jgi:hypothetical protein
MLSRRSWNSFQTDTLADRIKDLRACVVLAHAHVVPVVLFAKLQRYRGDVELDSRELPVLCSET